MWFQSSVKVPDGQGAQSLRCARVQVALRKVPGGQRSHSRVSPVAGSVLWKVRTGAATPAAWAPGRDSSIRARSSWEGGTEGGREGRRSRRGEREKVEGDTTCWIKRQEIRRGDRETRTPGDPETRRPGIRTRAWGPPGRARKLTGVAPVPG